MKASGSVWFGYAVAVAVTFVVGILAFSIFVLSKVFGSSAPEEKPPAAPQALSSPSTSSTPRIVKPTPAGTMAVQTVKANRRQLILIVATPTGCAQKVQAVPYAEGAGAVAVRITQRTYRGGCRWKAEPVLVTAKAPINGRTLLLNGVPWTIGADGEYEEALRTATS
ncbi:hypothetical protein [Streptomyces sp. SID13031]|uniref:hypothetical protein n=1 Tax=Streptomyces sp. SID13031 TaxID=2706046 RepID=UPI0013C75F08|nr:hypothetical protein [Streptomyces sp. SID13031]NEA37419.1 hypothetical protein [Streptomyces sp. SID13031]